MRYLALLIFTLFTSIAFATSEQTCASKEMQRILEIYNIINANYVKPVDHRAVSEAAINGMLHSLDSHSGYLTKEMHSELTSYTKGKFAGIGAEISQENGLIKVIAPFADSPAEKAGIVAGDYIVAIDGRKINRLNAQEEIKKIKGKPGTKVKLSIQRNNNPNPIELEIKRAIIKLNSVKASIISSDIGYVKVSSFLEETTSKNIINAIKQFLKSNPDLKGLILDLRNNPGGLLEQAVKTADIFIDNGVIVYTKGKEENSKTIFNASNSGYKFKELPLVILINEGSASASEIIAGALQDHKRAKIIGKKSYGKGSVQAILPLSGGEAVGLTTAYYYTPNHRLIDAIGIEPDLVVDNKNPASKPVKNNNIDAQRKLTLDKDEKSRNIIVSKADEDLQLSKAINLIKNMHNDHETK